ncbi:HD-GYP domain-containing protein [Bacillus massilinigeriensis]|uniref:HD-GYP domain-containing protein n=1 Tax=Bacillus massilionigeriensis TaxID=1805475 RepID=UPI00096B37C1|nr:HD domain-containing phosphohydrolase [Bacillus massilionigeriensis]
MELEQISLDLVGSELAEDIFSDQGILLLKKGTVLNETHILLLQNYRFGERISVDLSSREPSVDPRKSPTAKPYKSFQSQVKEAFRRLVNGQTVDLADIRGTYKLLVTLSLQDLAILPVIQKEINKSEYLFQHSVNSGIIAAMIGKLLGFSRNECYLLAEMGLFHDIGMLKVDEELYDNELPLTKSEFEQIQKHTEYGCEILSVIPELDPIITQTALYHHERLNGTGYPNQIKQGDIPFYIQIISVADCFNAMSMKRNYGEKKNHFNGVYELIDQTHKNYLNPAIVVPFVGYIMRQHLHQEVMLSNGKVGEIVFIHENEPHQPLVRVEDEYFDLRERVSLRIVGVADDKDAQEVSDELSSVH